MELKWRLCLRGLKKGLGKLIGRTIEEGSDVSAGI